MVDVKKLLEELRVFYTKQYEKNEDNLTPSLGYSSDCKPQFGFLEVPGSLTQDDYSTAKLILVAACRDDEYKGDVNPDNAVREMARRIEAAISELVAVRAIYEAALGSGPVGSSALSSEAGTTSSKEKF